jgi:hypothetical protein
VSKQTKILVIVAILAVAAGAIILWTLNKPAKTDTVKTNSQPVAAVSTPTSTMAPVTPTGSSKYTPLFRALARSKFIESCKAKVGQQYGTACNCGADYLGSHYTDIQLEKIYYEYHSTSKVPSEVMAAYDACKNK